MPTETVLLDLIDDNPHNPRQSYSVTRVKEMAQSLLQLGQIETPKARKVDGRYQLVSGHLRLRGLRFNQYKNPSTTPAEMRLEVFPLTDDKMYFAAVEENLRRHELTPLDLAKSVDAYLKIQPAATETEVGKQLGFTVGHVSNMRRVLRLPASMLDKINEGKISFTQGRELLVLEALDGAEEHMKSAYGNLKVGNKQWGEPNTVAGIQMAVYEVVRDNCRPLNNQFGGYRWKLLFDLKAAGCNKCEHAIKVVPQKGKSALFCTDAECWKKHQEEQRQAAAAEARERVRKEVISTAVKETALQEESNEDISKGIAAAPATISGFSQEKEISELRADQLASMEDDYPCKTCPKNADCDSSYVYVDSHKKYQCPERDKPPEVPAEEPAQEKVPEIPEEVMAKARKKAGTRAEVLDMMEISIGDRYNRHFKQGFASLDDNARYLDDWEECSERCTTGFQFAFDSRDDKPHSYMICSNPECLKKNKTARTRRLNAAGQGKKNRERRGIKEAVAATTVLDHGRMKLVLYTQLKGYHTRAGWIQSAKIPETWLWDKVSPDIKSHEHTNAKLWKAVDKLSVEALAKIVVEFCFHAVTDHGDIGDYKVKAEEQLGWLGVSIKEEEKDAKGSVKVAARRRGRGEVKATEADESPVATKES